MNENGNKAKKKYPRWILTHKKVSIFFSVFFCEMIISITRFLFLTKKTVNDSNIWYMGIFGLLTFEKKKKEKNDKIFKRQNIFRSDRKFFFWQNWKMKHWIFSGVFRVADTGWSLLFWIYFCEKKPETLTLLMKKQKKAMLIIGCFVFSTYDISD